MSEQKSEIEIHLDEAYKCLAQATGELGIIRVTRKLNRRDIGQLQSLVERAQTQLNALSRKLRQP